MTDDEIRDLDITKVFDDNPTGYILEVDLEYPRDLHELHNDYPLVSEKVTLTEEMLSSYSKSFPDQHVLTEKLVPNLTDKIKYVTHYVNLKVYIRLGMKLKQVHRVLQFDQSPWMKPYIDFNTDKRRQASGAGTNLKVGGTGKFFYSAPSLFKGARLSGGAQCMFGRAHIHCFVLKTGLQMKPL